MRMLQYTGLQLWELHATDAQRMSGSEFLEACSGVPYPALMQVLDEHMSALAVVQPREYESLMERIRALRQTR